MQTNLKREPQSVTAEGKSIAPLIDGVRVRYAVTLPDERGTVCEMYNPAWNFSDEPLVYVYQVTIRPGRVKGWAKHLEQDDRLFISQGTLRIALYDDRPDSPTYKMLNVIHLSELNRGLIHIPRGVFHAVQNIGHTDALFVNMPTKAYNHNDPDKYRLPLDNDIIPFRFDNLLGW
ncbi:MAG TPA: dTDP-4-dehydrorhamnose 3,5-epimerase family protein [Anaerolineae bacterium]|nr:dTDP-4-dehydrorhamnose 3,5-epimerase family protein [Anaerolineae bacterium]